MGENRLSWRLVTTTFATADEPSCGCFVVLIGLSHLTVASLGLPSVLAGDTIKANDQCIRLPAVASCAVAGYWEAVPVRRRRTQGRNQNRVLLLGALVIQQIKITRQGSGQAGFQTQQPPEEQRRGNKAQRKRKIYLSRCARNLEIQDVAEVEDHSPDSPLRKAGLPSCEPCRLHIASSCQTFKVSLSC